MSEAGRETRRKSIGLVRGQEGDYVATDLIAMVPVRYAYFYRCEPCLSEVLNAGLHAPLGSNWRIMVEDRAEYHSPNSELRSKRAILLPELSCMQLNGKLLLSCNTISPV